MQPKKQSATDQHRGRGPERLNPGHILTATDLVSRPNMQPMGSSATDQHPGRTPERHSASHIPTATDLVSRPNMQSAGPERFNSGHPDRHRFGELAEHAAQETIRH